jgi:hypothetical protein
MSNISKTGYRRRKELSLDGLHSAVHIFMALNTQSICKCVTREILFGTVFHISRSTHLPSEIAPVPLYRRKDKIKFYALAA